MDTAPEETADPSANLGATATAPAIDQAAPPPPGPARPAAAPRLHRGGRNRMLAGVAAGLADYFDVDPVIVRIAFVALAFLGGLAVPLYLAGWLLIPDEHSDMSVAEELLARERAHGAL